MYSNQINDGCKYMNTIKPNTYLGPQRKETRGWRQHPGFEASWSLLYIQPLVPV